jgi:PqqD family protein of HPr-rel-A system
VGAGSNWQSGRIRQPVGVYRDKWVVKSGTEVQRWEAPRDLIWTHYDDGDEWVVFDPSCGDVHLLTRSARVLWTLVSDERPHSLEDLVAAIAAELRCSPDERLITVTRETLAAMDRAGLVRPIPS